MTKSKEFKVLVVVGTAIVGFAAMGVFGWLVDQYERARDAVAEQTVVAQSTEVFIAMLSATPPPPPPTHTPLPSVTATPTLSPTPTASPLPPTPRPADGPTSIQWQTINKCDVIDSPGSYRLSADLTANGECIRIKSSNVLFDCFKHSIRGTNFTGSGIAIRKYGLLNAYAPAYVQVRNCRVSNFRDGIWVEAGDKLVIRDNESTNNYDDVDPTSRFGKFLGMTEGAGIRLNNTTSSQILNNITLRQAIGIDVRYSSGIIVRGNTASDNSAWGINILRTQNSDVSGNTTVDNVRQCTWGEGAMGWGCDAGGIVVQDGANGNTIANNQVTGRNGNGIFIKAHAMPCGSNNAITGNTITGVYYNAVELGFCAGNRVNNNNMRDGLDGIWLGYAHDTEIRDNTILNMRNHGIISSNSRGNTVSGNQIINSNEGLFFFSEPYDNPQFAWLTPGDYRSHSNCLCGNTFQQNAIAVHLKNSTHNQVTSNTFVNNGRIFLVQGNGDGNNLQGFNRSSPRGDRVAMRLPFPLRAFDISQIRW